MTTKFSSNSESQYFIPFSTNLLISTVAYPSFINRTEGSENFTPKPSFRIAAGRTRVNFVLIGRYQTPLGSLNVSYNLICFLSIENGLCLLPFLNRGFSALDRGMKYGSTAKEMRQKHPHNNHSFLSILAEINQETNSKISS